MKSGHHYKRTGLLIVATMVAGFVIGPASAQQQDQRQIKLLNVNPDTGMVEANKTLAIPLQVNSGAPILEVDAEGNINAYCHPNGSDGNGRCLSLGAGGGGDVSAPTITNLRPSATVPASNTTERLRWDTNAQFCYGVSVSPPSVAGWANSIQTSNGFTVWNLPRNEAGQGNKDYDFTLGCYSAPQQGAVGYTQVTHRVTLAPKEAGTPPDPDPPTGDFCNTYMQEKGLVAGRDGFQPTGLTRNASTYFQTFGRAVSATIINGQAGEGFPPGHAGGSLDYLSIAIDVPDDPGVINKGITFDWNEPQTQGLTGIAVDVTLSPCPGDFRRATSQNPTDPWLSYSCRKEGLLVGIINSTVGSANGNVGNRCKLVRGARMYLNVTTYYMDTQWSNSRQLTVADDRCVTGNICADKMKTPQHVTNY